MTSRSIIFFFYILLLPLASICQQNNRALTQSDFNQKANKSLPPQILRLYYNNFETQSEIESMMELNSKRLKHSLPKVYFKHELARVLFYKNIGKENQFISIIYKLMDSPLLENDHELNASFHTLTGIIYYDNERSIKARKHYKTALTSYKTVADSVGIKGNLINIGSTFFIEENHDSAIYYFQKALVFSKAGISEFDQNLKNNLATVYQNTGRYNEAKIIYEDLIKDFSTSSNNIQNNNSTTLFNLGVVFQKQDLHESAISTLKTSLEYLSNEKSQKLKSNIYRVLGHSYFENGNYKQAYNAVFIADSIRKIDNKIGTNLLLDEYNFKYNTLILEEKAKISLEKAKSEQKVKHLYLLFWIITGLLLTVILVLYIKKNQKNVLLAKKNLELTKPKKNIKDNSKNASIELIEQIEIVFINKKIYCKQDMSLDKLARILKTNRTYLSESINAHFGLSFSRLINKLRIQEARELLINKNFDHYSIEGIAQSVGYKSISTFNSTFKKETGITPSYFRKMNKTT